MTGLLNKGGLFSNKHKRVASIKNKKLKGHLVEHEYYSGIANCQARITAIFLVIFWTLEIFKFMYLFHDFRGTPKIVQRNPGFPLNLGLETGLYNMDILQLRFFL